MLRKDRLPRKKGFCTICGEKLPFFKKDWFLEWHDETGACKECVLEIRERIKDKPTESRDLKSDL